MYVNSENPRFIKDINSHRPTFLIHNLILITPIKHALWMLSVKRDHYVWRPPNSSLLWLCLLWSSFLYWARSSLSVTSPTGPILPTRVTLNVFPTWQLLLYCKTIAMYILPTIDPLLRLNMSYPFTNSLRITVFNSLHQPWWSIVYQQSSESVAKKNITSIISEQPRLVRGSFPFVEIFLLY